MPKLIGHETIIQGFQRLSEQGNLSHGYIFEGSSMIGKRTTAMALANFLEKGTLAVPTKNEVLPASRLVIIMKSTFNPYKSTI